MGEVFYIPIFIVRGSVRLDQCNVIDGGGGFDGEKYIPVFLGEKYAVLSNLCCDPVQKLVVDIQNILKMYALPGNIGYQL